MNKKIAGLILAAGYSSRMGELKALLPFGDETVIAKQIKCFKEAGITDIFIVVGYKAEEIKESLQGYSVHFILNERYSKGMFSSVQAGVRYIKNKSFDGFMMLPVDCPLVQPYSLEMMINLFDETDASIVYPSFNKSKGHPPLISCKLINSILEYQGDNGLKGILSKYREEAKFVEIGNDSILIDIDTKENYFDALQYMEKRIVPQAEERELLLKYHNVPQRVINHGKKVGEVAKIIAEEMINKGLNIDANLVYVGGLLHDFKKGSSNHAGKGAEIIYKMGYSRLSEIIKNHMNIDSCFVNQICEESIVYYSDKIIKETDIVTLKERIKKMKEKNTMNCYAEKKLNDAKLIQDKIESMINMSIFDLLKMKLRG